MFYFWRTLEYAAQHDATKIGVINIKDLDGVKNAINVITAEDSKIFQCISVTAKVIKSFAFMFLDYPIHAVKCF